MEDAVGDEKVADDGSDHHHDQSSKSLIERDARAVLFSSEPLSHSVFVNARLALPPRISHECARCSR
jgi:hypothetical protein